MKARILSEMESVPDMPDTKKASHQKFDYLGSVTCIIKTIVPNNTVFARLTHHGKKKESMSGCWLIFETRKFPNPMATGALIMSK